MASKLLINEPPLQVLPSLAVLVGLNEAIVLQQVHYWLGLPEIGRQLDGRRYVRNTVEQWIEHNFPFWHENTFRRAVKSLKKQGLLLTTRELNRQGYDKTLWYSVDYDALAELEKTLQEMEAPAGPPAEKPLTNMVNAINQNGESDITKTVKPIPETHIETQADIKDSGRIKKYPARDGRSEYVFNMETLEETFVAARGGFLPDWDADPKAAQALWRTPCRKMLKWCGGDLEYARLGIAQVVAHMKAGQLIFSEPKQIEKVFRSWAVDGQLPAPSKKKRAAGWNQPQRAQYSPEQLEQLRAKVEAANG